VRRLGRDEGREKRREQDGEKKKFWASQRLSTQID
jgi:hypothetical protein